MHDKPAIVVDCQQLLDLLLLLLLLEELELLALDIEEVVEVGAHDLVACVVVTDAVMLVRFV